MGGQEIETVALGPVAMTPALQRAAAVRIADHVAAENPHPLDGQMPKLAGRLTGRNPAAATELRELLDAVFGTRLNCEPQEGP